MTPCLARQIAEELAAELGAEDTLKPIAVLSEGCDRCDAEPDVARRLRARRTYALDHLGELRTRRS